jgi:RNA polymerase sigma factor (sigma-70 family)
MQRTTPAPPRFDDPAELLAAVGDGDPVAWTEIVRRHEGLLRHVCRNHRMTREQTADVMQGTWVQLYLYAHRIRRPSGVAAWLMTTTARECLAVSRRERRELPIAELPADAAPVLDGAPAAGSAEVEERLDAAARHARLRQAVRLLPPRERALVMLLLEPDLPAYSEISARLGMPVGAIGPVRQRALRRLRAWLEDEVDLDGLTDLASMNGCLDRLGELAVPA